MKQKNAFIKQKNTLRRNVVIVVAIVALLFSIVSSCISYSALRSIINQMAHSSADHCRMLYQNWHWACGIRSCDCCEIYIIYTGEWQANTNYIRHFFANDDYSVSNLDYLLIHECTATRHLEPARYDLPELLVSFPNDAVFFFD